MVQYAPPLLRPASPASSIGTVYGPDQTSPSDAEGPPSYMTLASFTKKVEDEIGLNLPREEELIADYDPLAIVPVPYVENDCLPPGDRPNNGMVKVGERPSHGLDDIALFNIILTSLRSEIAILQENELFEQILQRGSQAALETTPQPTTNDVDLLMRSMMVTNLGASRRNVIPHPASRVLPMRKENVENMTNGPWNNFGGDSAGLDFNFERRESTIPRADNDNLLLSGSTVVGKRNRNGTNRRW